MKNRTLPNRQKNGVAVLTVMGFILISSTLAAALLFTAGTHNRIAARQLDHERAFNLAEAALERGGEYVVSHSGYIFYNTPQNGTLGGGSYNYLIQPTAWRQASITSTGTYNSAQVTLHVDRVYLPSYATFALWSNQNDPIYMTAGEEFFGKVHANDALYFSSSSALGGPTFWEKVTSGANTYHGNLDHATFHKGFEYPKGAASLAAVDFGDMKSLAQTHGLVLEGRTSITMDNGVARITNTRAGMSDTPVVLGPQQLIYIKNSNQGDHYTRLGKVDMNGGQLDGRLTIVAESDIRVNNHLRYAVDPRVDPTSDDALGLISKDDVWVTTSAPNNLDIHAAILAAGQYNNNRGSFGALSYNQGSPRGNLNLLGSITQDLRGAVGTFNQYGTVSGFVKKYAFDDRFETTAPPFYPTISEEVNFEGWEQR